MNSTHKLKISLKVKSPTSQTTSNATDPEDDLLAWPLLNLKRYQSDQHLGTDLNQGLIAEFTSLIDLAKVQKSEATSSDQKKKHQFRITSFERALASLRSYPHQIVSGQQAQSEIKGIGKGIAQRINEYCTTGKIEEAHKPLTPQEKIMAELNTVWGIGDATATMLITQYSVVSVLDLQKKVKNGTIPVGKGGITQHVAAGLHYHNDLQQRMSWEEADQIARELKALITRYDPELSVIICGSYRRLKGTCGDIDVLVSKTSITESSLDTTHLYLLPTLVKQLSPLIVASLTSLGATKYMGICQLTGSLGRRIDIRCVPWDCMGAATLYFTGSGRFNQIMRYHANKRGYTLNEYGLYHYVNGQKGELVPATTEEDIFKILNFVYLPPNEREF